MANQRITDSLLPNTYADGEILYGAELRKIVGILKAASNADIEELQASFTGSVASKVVHYDLDPNRDVDGYLLDYSDFEAIYDELTEGDSIFVFIDTVGGTVAVDDAVSALYTLETDGGTYATSTFTKSYNLSVAENRVVIEAYNAALENEDSSLANRIAALEALTDQAVLETSDVTFNSVTSTTSITANSIVVTTTITATAVEAETVDASVDVTTPSIKLYDDSTSAVAEMSYNSVTGQISIDFGTGKPNGQLFEELWFQGYNSTGVTIPDGSLIQVVYPAVFTSNKPQIKLANRADLNMYGGQLIMGVVTEPIANNTFGKITWFGEVNDIDTSAWAQGDILFANTNTGAAAGSMLVGPPTKPNAKVQIALVEYSHAVQGRLLVRPWFFPFLGESADVDVSTAVAGEFFKLDADGIWRNYDLYAELFTGGKIKPSLIPNEFAEKIEGYFNPADNLFYEEAGFVTPLVGDATAMYFDLNDTSDLYAFTGTIWVSTHAIASEVTTNTTNFDGLLSGADDNVQKALETFDDIDASDIPAIDTAFAKLFKDAGITTIQEALDFIDDNVAPSLDGEPQGFVDRTDVTLGWSNATRTLSLTGTYDIYENGVKYTKTDESYQIPDVEGLHYIYYDNTGTLASSQAFSSDIIERYAFVASLYWDATNKVVVPNVMCELHGVEMPAEVHSYLHRVFSTQYVSGISLTLDSSGNGTAASDIQVTSNIGYIEDEDVMHTVVARGALTDTIPVLYREGANWRFDESRSYPVINTGTGRVAYNQDIGGVWQLTEVTNLKYTLVHFYALPGLNTSSGRLAAIMGQSQYNTISDAREGATQEAFLLNTSGLPFVEFKVIATAIVQTADNYSNAAKARFIPTDTGADYIDWRVEEPVFTGGISASQWGTITGTLSDQTDLQNALNLKADKANVLELDNTDAYDPTANYHPATKKYVDDIASEISTQYLIDKFTVNAASPSGYTLAGTAYTFTVATPFYAASQAWEVSLQYLNGTERTFYPTSDDITEGTVTGDTTDELILDIGATLTDGDEIYIKYLLGAGITITNIQASGVVYDPSGQDVISQSTTNIQDALTELANKGASVTVSDTAPVAPAEGDLWWDSTIPRLNIWYSSNWIDTQGYVPQFFKQSTTPTGMNDNDYWFNTSTFTLSVYHSSTWVAVRVLAANVTYSNGTSGLTAQTVQAAIDEVEGRLDTAESNIATKDAETVYTTSILTSDTWTLDVDHYYLEKTVSGLLVADDNNKGDLFADYGSATVSMISDLKGEFGKIFDATIPSVDTIRIKALEALDLSALENISVIIKVVR